MNNVIVVATHKKAESSTNAWEKCWEDDLMCLQTISFVNGLIEERAVLYRLILPLLVWHEKLHDRTDFEAILNVKCTCKAKKIKLVRFNVI